MNPKKLAALVERESKNPMAPKFKKKGKPEEGEGEDNPKKGGDEEEEEEDEDDLSDIDPDLLDPDKVAQTIEDGDGDEELRKMANAVDPEENPPKWATHPAKWKRAEDAISDEKWDEYDEPYAVVAHIYKNMGGGIKRKDPETGKTVKRIPKEED